MSSEDKYLKLPNVNLQAEICVICVLLSISDFEGWKTPSELFKIDEKLFTLYKPIIKASKKEGLDNVWRNIIKGQYPNEREGIEDEYLNFAFGWSKKSLLENLENFLEELKKDAIERENKKMIESLKTSLSSREADKIRADFEERKNNIRVKDEDEITTAPEMNILNRLDGGEDEENVKYLTGLKTFDEYLKIKPWQINIIGARPSVWKSMLALNLALRNLKAGLNVGYFSFEMWEEQVLTRVFACLSGVSLKTFGGKVEDEETRAKILKAIDKFSERKQNRNRVFSENYDLRTVINEIRRRAKEYNTKIFYIDHIGLLRGDKSKPRYQEIGYMVEELKHLAEELKITIFLLSQLNRQANVNDYWERPDLQHLSESGILEQIGSIIMLLYRDFRDESEDKELLEVYVRKNRDGKTWRIDLKIDPAFMRIKDLEEKKKEENVKPF